MGLGIVVIGGVTKRSKIGAAYGMGFDPKVLGPHRVAQGV
ncbi:hypothetical protein GFS31_17260 [Leptolyngbya sp. BL0902]|nr:hypothetical protein GFS31_17260 [Leptolyngbya sp. BL0902]